MSKQIITQSGAIDFISVDSPLTVTVDGALTVNSDTTIKQNLVVDGNLTIKGTGTQLDITQLEIEDPLLDLNTTTTGPVAFTGVLTSGLNIFRGANPQAKILWTEDSSISKQQFEFVSPFSTTKIKTHGVTTFDNDQYFRFTNEFSPTSFLNLNTNQAGYVTISSTTLPIKVVSPDNLEFESTSIKLNGTFWPSDTPTALKVAVTDGAGNMTWEDYAPSTPTAQAYDLSFYVSGVDTTSNEIIHTYVAPRNIQISSESPHRAHANTPDSAGTSYEIYVNDLLVGSVTFAASSNNGLVIIGSESGDVNLVPGDVVKIRNPAAPSLEIKDISITLIGSLV